MSTKKWSEIKKLSKATQVDRAEACAELTEEIRNNSQYELTDDTRTSQPDATNFVNGESSVRDSNTHKRQAKS
jgi:hypothetical protein